MRSLALVALVAGCSSTYAYTFHVRDARAPGDVEGIEDADVKAAIAVDPGADAVRLDVTNKTDQVLQVAWADISLARADGSVAALRPLADLGWIQPGATQTAQLLPLVLPRHDKAALADDGRAFEVRVPVVVRREARLYRVTLTARVREL